MKKLFVTSGCAIALLFCGLFATVVSAKTIVAGVEPSFPPWAYVKKGKFKGIAVDGMRAIAKEEGLKVKFKDLPFPSLIPALVTGKIDMVVTGLLVTKKRAKAVDYTIPWFESNDVILVPKKSDKNIFTAVCCGAKIGVQNGSTQESWMKKHVVPLKNFGASVKAYDSYVTAVDDMLAGRLTSVDTAATTAATFISNGRPVKIVGKIDLHAPLALAVKKGDPQHLLPKLNKGIMAMSKDGKWAQIVHKYIHGATVPNVPAYMPTWVNTYKKPVPGLPSIGN
ncbi:MAG TPA: ABC transporter substrate-binding protein [Gammaproteobacteria bacterium]|nr:ABC transporter substrate-binding protein [Gammaproteobacteria bacterium]